MKRKHNIISIKTIRKYNIELKIIINKKQAKYMINYSKDYEYQIYKTGLIKDNYIWRNIKNIKIPTIIIRAEESNAFLENSANKVKKLNNNIKIVTLKETTPLFPLEKPLETANIINRFLEELKTNNL